MLAKIIFYCIANVFFNLIIAYFFTFYLNCRNRCFSYFALLFFIECILWPMTLYMYDAYVLKQIISFFLLLAVLFLLFPDNSKIQIFSSFLIHAITVAFTEFITIMVYFLVSGIIITSTNAWEIPFGYYIIDIFMLFTLFTLYIRLKRKEEIANNRYRFFQLCLLGSHTLLFLFICYCFVGSEEYLPLSSVLLFAVGILSFMILLFLGLVLFQLEEQKQKSLFLLQKEYANQMKLYFKIADNDEKYRQLRHDLINYLVMNKKEKQS